MGLPTAAGPLCSAALCVLLLMATLAEIEAARNPKTGIRKLHDHAHASQKYKKVQDANTGRTGFAKVKGPHKAGRGRKMLQATGDQTIVPGGFEFPDSNLDSSLVLEVGGTGTLGWIGKLKGAGVHRTACGRSHNR